LSQKARWFAPADLLNGGAIARVGDREYSAADGTEGVVKRLS